MLPRSLLLLPALLLSSCGIMMRLASSKPKATEAPPRSEQEVIGSIALVNPQHRFVLIQVPRGFTLPKATALKAYNAQNKVTAELKSSDENQGNYMTADIQSGAPSQHDVVMRFHAKPEAKGKPKHAAPGATDGPAPAAQSTPAAAPPPVIREDALLPEIPDLAQPQGTSPDAGTRLAPAPPPPDLEELTQRSKAAKPRVRINPQP
jgi:hypothetical protein